EEATALKCLGVSSCSLIHRSGSKFLPLPHLSTPFTFRTFTAREVQRALQKELIHLLAADHRRQTFVVFDGLHPFAALSPQDLQALSTKCRGVVYRAHNVETALWEQCVEKARTPWLRWVYRYQAARVRTFERRI